MSQKTHDTGKGQSSLTRMLAVFDMFNGERPALGADEIVERLGTSRTTGYRYIRELCRAGFLSRVGGTYALGPRIIELDYVIREADPMLVASRPVLRELRDAAGCDVLLASIFGDRIIATHHEQGPDRAAISFGRGRPMPLFRGAGSKAIAACSSASRQREVFERNRHAAAAAGYASWDAFRAEMRAVRRRGIAVSAGELDADNVAVAAPIVHDPQSSPGCVIAVFGKSRYAIADKTLLERIVKAAAARIALTLAQQRDPALQKLAILPLKDAM
jgi:DNA-binding IclR family transcriptional regulator